MRFSIQTKGHYDFADITEKVKSIVSGTAVQRGIVNIFSVGSTTGLTTMEFEEGTKQDLINVWETLAPEHAEYKHHKKWSDHNGAAHIKSALLKTDLTIPIEDGELCLGTWQHIILIDFDERPRSRDIIITIIDNK